MATALQQTGLAEVPLTPEFLEQWAANAASLIPPYPEQALAENAVVLTKKFPAIAHDQDKLVVAETGRILASHEKAVIAHYKPYRDASNRLKDAILAAERTATTPISGAKDRASGLIVTYDTEQRRKAAEAQRKAEEEARERQREEQRRIEAEAQKEAERLEAEAAVIRKAEAEERERQRIAAAKLEAQGRAAEAEKMRQADLVRAEQAKREADAKAAEAAQMIQAGIEQAQEVQVEIIITPTPEPVKAAGTSKRAGYDFELIDKMSLISAASENPSAFAQFLCIDDKLVRAFVNRQGKDCRIPGVRVFEKDEKVAFRKI